MAVPKKLKTESLRSSIEQQTIDPKSYVQEEMYLDREVETKIRIEELNTIIEYNKTLAQNTSERKKYAHKIFLLTVWWSVLIFFILFLKGWYYLDLSDKVIITLITSTTANFFGFFFLVTKYLFNTEAPKVSKSVERKTKLITRK